MDAGQMGLAVFAAFVIGTAIGEAINGLHAWLDRRAERRQRAAVRR